MSIVLPACTVFHCPSRYIHGQKDKSNYLGKTNFPGNESFGKFLVGASLGINLLFVIKST